jgi:hypothetical protein
LFTQATSEVLFHGTRRHGKACIVGYRTSASEHRKSTDMGQILVAVATKIGAALAEALILRLAWQLWAAYARHQRTVTAPAAA